MNEPWFNPMWSFLPGTLLGVTAGLFGAACGVLLPRGKGRSLIARSYWLLLGISGLLLVLGVVAYFMGQPYGIWYGLGLAGVIGTFVLGFNGPVLFKQMRLAEERRMKAQDV